MYFTKKLLVWKQIVYYSDQKKVKELHNQKLHGLSQKGLFQTQQRLIEREYLQVKQGVF